jgi:Uma2 family endonuclease
MAPQTSTPMTYQDLLELPDDGNHYELIDGELYVNAAPLLRHQRILRRIVTLLDRYLEDHQAGEVFFSPTDVVLAEDNVVEPDAFVICSSRAVIAKTKSVEGAPNIVIEVLSDGTRRRDEVMKRQLYERYGVDEYWIVDPTANRVTVYRRSGEAFVRVETDDVITTPLLPGFSLALEDVFAP